MSEAAATPGPVAQLTASRVGGRTFADRLLVVIIYVGMVAFALSIVYPFWYLLVDSFNTPEASILDRVKFWPRDMTLDNYRKVFDSGIIGTAYLNSLFKAIVGTALILLISFMAAFGLADRTMPGIKVVTFFMIFTMFFSGGLIPTYLWYKQLGLLNSRLVWFLPALANAFYIIIMRNFFREIPAELTESATIDGATLTDILFRIVVPLSAPVVATVALWAAVAHWNDWFFPLIFTPEKDKTVLQVLLRRVLVENQTSELELFEEHEVRNITAETVKAALLFISIGPIIAVYPFIQRYFVKGIMLGAVKG
jgi:putative aldouronate transport system permease protein